MYKYTTSKQRYRVEYIEMQGQRDKDIDKQSNGDSEIGTNIEMITLRCRVAEIQRYKYKDTEIER